MQPGCLQIYFKLTNNLPETQTALTRYNIPFSYVQTDHNSKNGIRKPALIVFI